MLGNERAFSEAFFRRLFDKIYIINLRERADRRVEMEEQLALVGLGYADAIVEIVEGTRPDDQGDFPSIGARGCFLSHLDALSRAVDAGHKSILIMEDDVDWTRSALSLGYKDIEVIERAGWHFLHGGDGRDARDEVERPFRLCRLDPNDGKMLAHFLGLRGEVIGLAREYLLRILTRPPGSPLGGPMHVDGAYSWMRRANPHIEGYIAVPSLAVQRSSKSDIHVPHGWRAIPGVQGALHAVRQYRRRFRKILPRNR